MPKRTDTATGEEAAPQVSSVEASSDGENALGQHAKPRPEGTIGEIDDSAMVSLHASMLSIWDNEADRFWVRSNLLLVVNGVLLGGAIASNQSTETVLLICAFGLFFSWSWLLMNRKSGYYVSRWRPVIEQLEKKMSERSSFPILPLLAVRPDKESKEARSVADIARVFVGTKRSRRGAGGIMRIVIVGFVLAWLGLGALSLERLLSGQQRPGGNQTETSQLSREAGSQNMISDAEFERTEENVTIEESNPTSDLQHDDGFGESQEPTTDSEAARIDATTSNDN